MKTGPVFIKHLESNVYVTLSAIGSFQCNLCSHWLIQIFITVETVICDFQWDFQEKVTYDRGSFKTV